MVDSFAVSPPSSGLTAQSDWAVRPENGDRIAGMGLRADLLPVGNSLEYAGGSAGGCDSGEAAPELEPDVKFQSCREIAQASLPTREAKPADTTVESETAAGSLTAGCIRIHPYRHSDIICIIFVS